MSIDTLIEHLEQAAAPAPALDAEIAVALRIKPPRLPDWTDRNFPVWRAREDGRVEVVHDNGRGGVHWEPPAFTASVDAALTLVPDGLMVSMTIGLSRLNTVANVKTGSIANPDTKEWSGYSRHGAALALSAAALKARLASTNGTER